MKEEINKMLKDEIIEKSKGLWASPIVLVARKDEGIRFCVDFKKINKIIILDVYLLSVVNDTVDKFEGKKWFSFSSRILAS